MSLLNIEYTEKILPDAYHGTSKAKAQNIMQNGFTPSTGPGQYLGDGVYFFESSITDAEDWARRNNAPADCAVIQAAINLGRCLDLFNPEHEQILRETAARLQDDMNRRRNRGIGHREFLVTDALTISLVSKLVSIDTVRAIYPVGTQKKVFRGSHFVSRYQIFICVKNMASILRLKVL
jgi:hypothetical protein